MRPPSEANTHVQGLFAMAGNDVGASKSKENGVVVPIIGKVFFGKLVGQLPKWLAS